MPDFSPAEAEHVALCEVLDRILNKGAVIIGEVRISVANIDLIYLGLQIVLTSIETARDIGGADGKGETMLREPSKYDQEDGSHDVTIDSAGMETADGPERSREDGIE